MTKKGKSGTIMPVESCAKRYRPIFPENKILWAFDRSAPCWKDTAKKPSYLRVGTENTQHEFSQWSTKKMKHLISKYKHLILYGVFGVGTTVVNWASYYLCFHLLSISNVVSNIIAWILAVAFAFVTNKIWVFGSRAYDPKTLLYEIWTFVAARLATGVLDLGIMYWAVDLHSMNASLWKLLSNLIVILLNYIFSKLIIFKAK